MTKIRIIPLAASLLGLLAMLVFAGCRSAHTTSAILYIEEQQYQLAVDVIHEGFEYQDDEPDAYYYLGEAYAKLAEVAIDDNDYYEAKQYYEKSYIAYNQAKELDIEGYGELADLAMQHNYTMRSNEAKRENTLGYYEPAEGFFRLAYAALPDSISAIKNIARMKMRMANEDTLGHRDELLAEALALLDQVLAVRPDAYLLNNDKANVLAELGRSAEAQVIYDQLLAEHGDDPALLTDIANLAIDKGDYGRAAELSVQIADIYANDTDPSNDSNVKDLQLNAGTWFSLPTVGRYEEAIAALERAAELDASAIVPSRRILFQRAQTYYNYGRKLKEEGDTARATEMFQRGVDIGNVLTNNYPTFAEGYLFLSLCQTEMGDFGAAEPNYKAYEELQGG